VLSLDAGSTPAVSTKNEKSTIGVLFFFCGSLPFFRFVTGPKAPAARSKQKAEIVKCAAVVHRINGHILLKKTGFKTDRSVGVILVFRMDFRQFEGDFIDGMVPNMRSKLCNLLRQGLGENL